MNRRILIQVTTPGVIIGLLLFVACLAGAWYIDRLQSNTAKVLSRNVTSLQAALELEKFVRQLRWHSFLNLIDPRPARQKLIDADHQHFEDSLRSVRRLAHTAEEQALVDRIDKGYQDYLQELAALGKELAPKVAGTEFAREADKHPVNKVAEPCVELLNHNKDMVDETSADNARVSKQVRYLMIFLGIVGPISGLLVGFAVARGLSRSIYQLSVRVQDITQRLEQDVAAVSIQADGDVASLDRQLQQVVGRVEEVAERLQRQQRELLRAEQLSAVGQLAASVAHEVRNPLTAVKMLVEAALRTRNPKTLTADDLKVIHGEIARLEHTVQSFLDFARLPTPKRSRCDLREIIQQALEIIQVRAGQQRVETAVRDSDRPMTAYVDRDQLCHVLVNLFLNALDAMPPGGRLEITLEEIPDERLSIAIADTGAGIPPEMEGRLFTPFASSKPTGTGLGLSISRRIIEEHGGAISARGRPEGGTCFTITLPAEADEENRRSKVEDRREIVGQGLGS